MNGPGATVESGAVSIVGAADSSYKSRIPLSATFVTVTANTNDTNDWVVLPTGVTAGHVVRGWSVPAHEMRTFAGSNLKINNVDGDGTQEAVIPATTLWKATYINATVGWILELTSELGAVVTAVVPD
jgi:hypothetical protein